MSKGSLELTIDREDRTPLYYQIKKQLLSLIQEEVLKTDCPIPPETTIASQYGISRSVARQAILELTREGFFHRIPRRGTFVAAKQRSQIGLLVRTEGHIFSSLFQGLMRNVSRETFGPVVINPTPFQTQEKEEKQYTIERIRQLLNSKPPAIIVDGTLEFPFELLQHKSPKTRIVFMFRLETKKALAYQYHSVLSDFAAGGRTAIEHLLNLGHRKIVFLSCGTPHPDQFSHYFLYEGCCQALRERGLSPEKHLSIVPNGDNVEEELSGLLLSEDPPTAVFAYEDFYSRPFFRVCDRLNLRVPDDVAFIGYYNTPWTETAPVPLTSVSILPEKIAELTMQIAQDKGGEEETRIIVKPELVIRESCGYRKQSSENNNT